MPDWVKASLVKVKARRERRNHNSAAVKNKGEALFRRFADLANAAVAQFNEGDDLNFLTLAPGPSYTIAVQARGKEGARIQISLDLEREVITYSYRHLPDVSNGELYLRATESGDLILKALSPRNQIEPITEDVAIQKLFEPLFNSVN